jgi:hypothetical protein
MLRQRFPGALMRLRRGLVNRFRGLLPERGGLGTNLDLYVEVP